MIGLNLGLLGQGIYKGRTHTCRLGFLKTLISGVSIHKGTAAATSTTS